jgi:SOS-response transcriptional repressor LexA
MEGNLKNTRCFFQKKQKMIKLQPNQRLMAAREALGLTLREFAAPLSRTHASVFDWEKGRAPIQPIIAEAIEKHHGISALWLMDGKGEMFVRQSAKLESTLVPILTTQPCAGTGTALDDYAGTEGGITFDVQLLRASFGVNPQNVCLMWIDGDSMAPTIAPGELVFVDGLRTPPCYRDGVWVLSLGGNLLVKRVQLLAPANYRVTSDNPAYQAIQLDGPAMLLGRVVGGLQRY